MKEIEEFDYTIGVIGVGYVGLPLVKEFSKHKKVYAYDIDCDKINLLKINNDVKNIEYTYDEKSLLDCDAIIVAVPTPIDSNNNPDLTYVLNACEIIGKNLSKNTLVVFESSYKPKTTMNICVPIIEKNSHMDCGIDFYIGYSPERINPGDNIHLLNNITKIISAQNDDVLLQVEKLYKLIDNIQLHKTNNIEVAELSKMIENTQRDINIAFINEVSKLCHSMDVKTDDVLSAARTKWNFYDVKPGLVGGHCISIDPYYLLQLSKEVGAELTVVNSARKVNETMSDFIVQSLVKLIDDNYINHQMVRIGIYGYSYKANCDDIRNTKVKDIYDKLKQLEFNCVISDYNLKDKQLGFENHEKINNVDVLIFAVAHDQYRTLSMEDIISNFNKNSNIKIIFDLNSIYKDYRFPDNYIYWSL